MSPRQLQARDLLDRIDRSGAPGVGRQLEEKLRNALRSGTLAPGGDLPSTRALAEDLSVSRGVVVRTYPRRRAARGTRGGNPRRPAGASERRTPLRERGRWSSRRRISFPPVLRSRRKGDDRRRLRRRLPLRPDADRRPSGLSPEQVAYIGSTGNTPSPRIRLGWAVLPPELGASVAVELGRSVLQLSGIDQLALANFVRRGEFDRHLRRMRTVYRRRRDALVRALETQPPLTPVSGMAAGLHVVVEPRIHRC
jgi:DNA-binding transcriptional MocR family regulator